MVPPDSDVPGQGLQVQLQLRVFKIITVDMTSGTLRLQAWRRLRWKDPRLAWNVSEWNGVNEIRAVPGIHTGGAADAPDNNIWEPRLHHYNSASHPEETLEEGAAWIYPDGSVFQSKPGGPHTPAPSVPYRTHYAVAPLAHFGLSDVVASPSPRLRRPARDSLPLHGADQLPARQA